MARDPSSDRIRVKALGLNWRASRLLGADIYDEEGRLSGVRPLGGSVEFGETARDAVIREFREELGIEVTVLSGPIVLENVFAYHGKRCHEILFVFDVAFPEGAFEGLDRLAFREGDGTAMEAAWHDLHDLDVEGRPALYPQGLKSRLLSR